jgi:hypothetical protein
MKNIFIIGAPRSGTNLLRDLLTKHNDISTWPCDEINMVWRYDNIDQNDELKIADINKLNKLYIRSFFKKLKYKTKTKYILEKTCANSLRVDFVNYLFPKSFFIFLHRDKGDTLNSILIKSRSTPKFTYIFKKFLFVPTRYKIKYIIGYIDFFYKIYFLKKSEPSSWGPKISIPINIKNKSFEKRMAYMINKCYLNMSSSKKNIPRSKQITINYNNLVHDPKNIIKKILSKIDIDLIDKADQINYDNVYTNSIGLGKKFKKFF